MSDSFSPQAAAVDREIMATATNGPAPIPEGDDYEAASSAYWRSLELVKLNGTRVPLPSPIPEKLASHVKFYGDVGVEEILRAYGQGKPDALSLRQQGYSVEEIAKRRLRASTLRPGRASVR